MAVRLTKLGRLSLAAAALVLFLVFTAAAEPKVLGVVAIGLTVADMDRSVAFFSQALTFKKVSDTEFHRPEFDRLTGIFGARVRLVTMQLGEESIELTEYLTPQGRPIPPESRSNDRWFQHLAVVVRDMDAAYGHLRQLQVKPISTEPQRIPDWNKEAAGIRAFYFRDPDNHPLEIIYFPPGKGDPRWQQKGDALFLGIDHTAIAVTNTENSLRFYHDVLGFKVTGRSLNYGIEQEYLSHVFGAWVKITSLRAPQGPGIEFLEYLTPGDGRPYPEDTRPNDLWNWSISLLVEKAGEFFNRMRSKNIRFISPAVVNFSSPGIAGKKALLVRDPDGHALQLVEP